MEKKGQEVAREAGGEKEECGVMEVSEKSISGRRNSMCPVSRKRTMSVSDVAGVESK